MSQTLACNYGTQDLQDMLVKTSLSDGYITTSRFASDGLGNVAGGTGTPAADIPAAIDPTKFTQLAGAKPCSPDTEADQKLVNGCPDPAQVGAADGDPAYEGGQLGGSPANRSCAPSGALATLLQNLTGDAGTRTVTAHVPNGTWATSSTGVQVVPIEPTPVAAPVSVLTANPVNSCASNSQTGQTVCAANNTDIYLLSGTSLTSTMTSGATASAGFTGGSCQNCGVAINQATNTAAIMVGLSGPPSGSGIQFLDLGTNKLSSPVAAANQVSEGIVWDPNRNLVLSPNEGAGENGAGIYDLFDTSAVPSPITSSGQVVSAPEFANPVYIPCRVVARGGAGTGTFLDSAAEDCSTGIALASDEFKSYAYITDLTQATFTAGSPAGSWTAPQQFLAFPEFSGFAAGISGIAVAPDTHLAVATGEFGGNQFGVLQLPATSGTGTPNVVDYAAASLPNTPGGQPWFQGLDPHTVTAYVSPNDGKAYALMANLASVPCSGSCEGYTSKPTWLAVIDMAALLAAPRVTTEAGPHNVDPSYDLIGNGVVRYVATGN